MFAGLPALYLFAWVFIIAGVMILIGYLASRVIPGEGSDFILEIPPLRIPLISNVVVKTLARIEWYLKEAVPLFILGTLILFVLHKTKILTFLEWAATPLIVHLLGLPAKVTEAFLIGFLRRDYGAAGLFMLSKEGQLNPHQILVSLVTITLFIPCIANFFMILKERGWKTGLAIAGFILPFSVAVGAAVNLLMRRFY